MLTLGTDTTTFDFKFDNSEKVYSLPLMTSLPLVKLRNLTAIAAMPDGADKELAAVDMQLDLLREYMGDDAETLTATQVQAIFAAWQEAGGAELGE